MELGKKADRYFLFGIVAVGGIAIEVFWLFNKLNDKLTDLQLALGAQLAP